MPNNSITCAYCAAVNPAGTSRCLACGAPIVIPVTPPLRIEKVDPSAFSAAARPDTTPGQINDALDAAPISEQLKDGLKAAGAGFGALGIWSILSRTGAEALAIAFSAFLIGYTSGSVRSAFLGLGGGILIGLAVGLVVKRFWLVMISAPFGTLLGMTAAYFVQSLFHGLPNLPWSPILGIGGGVLFALLGGRRNNSGGVMNVYQRIRPFLGMAGGFIFAVLGYALGSLIH